MKRRIVIITVLTAIAMVAWLLIYLWTGPHSNPFTVTNNGPLDIRLWGIRPDVGGVIYDPNGDKIRDTLGIAQWNSPHWPDNSQRFDFIFELPDTNELPVFTRFPGIEVSYENTPLGGSFGHRFFDYEGKKLLWLTTGFPRTYRRSVLFGLWTTDRDVEMIDITLSYYHGPPGKADFTLRGPFEPNDVMTSEDGVYKVAFMPDGGPASRPHARFVLTTSAYFQAQTPVVAYDTSGGRCPAAPGNASSSTNPKQGSRIQYDVPTSPLKAIAAIAFGEDRNRITFKNVNLNAAPRTNRNHADYLDEMAERLGLTVTGKELADYKFKTATEALKVIDIVRGSSLLRATGAIIHGRGGERFDPEALTDEQSGRLRQTLCRWLTAIDPEVRALAVELGLLCKWPEFVNPAFELLNSSGVSARHDASNAAYALKYYAEQLSDHDIDRIKEILLRSDNRSVLSDLKRCLWSPKSPARIEALKELASADGPWLWWDAIERLSQWREFSGSHDSLADKVKLRLFLIRGPYGFSNAEQIAPKAYDLLDELLTLRLRELDSGTFFKVLERIVGDPDRRFATAALINFLGRIEDYDRSSVYAIDKTVKYINLWSGLDIGALGTDVTQDTRDIHEYDWPAITAEAIEWYDSKYKATDPNAAGSGSR